MALSVWVENICQLLGFCGLTSIRMFLPTFLYFLVLRLSVIWPKYFPEIILTTSSRIPTWQISTVFLSVLGVLAVAEMVALRCPELKKFLTEDFDRYAKPVLSMLVLTGILSSQQQEAAGNILEVTCHIQAASFFSPYLLLVIPGGVLTYLYCCIRARFFDFIYSIDPDGGLGISKFVNSGEEIFLILVFLLLVFLPLIAFFLVLSGMIFAYAVRRICLLIDRKHSHFCAECTKKGLETLLSDSAVICPVCHSVQPVICELGFLGFASSKKITGDLRKHVFNLQKSKRCRFCASPMKKNDICGKCGGRQWSAESVKYFMTQMRKRELFFCILALFSLIYPWFAFFLFLLSFHFFMIRPYMPYLGISQSFFSKFIFTNLKILLIVLMFFLSTIPFIGVIALLPFLFRYLFVKQQFCRNINSYLE